MSTGINLKDARPRPNNPTGNFDLSHRVKFDFQFGRLVPSLCLPVMPGDDIYLSFDQLVRMAPFKSQVYGDFIIATDFYYVPNRLLWHDFNNFMTAGYNGKHEYVHPYIEGTKVIETIQNILPQEQHNIFNYLDIPNIYWGVTSDHSFSYPLNAFPWAAYLRVYLDYWLGVGQPINQLYEEIVSRDNSILTEGDNSDILTYLQAQLASSNPDYVFPEEPSDNYFDELFAPLYRLYPLDYFTQARPDPQLGPVMTIPMKLVNTDANGTQTFTFLNAASSSNTNDSLRAVYTAGSKNMTVFANSAGGASNPIVVNASVLNNVASIPDFYSAARIQELCTLYGFSGFMPQDTVAAEFGVNLSDKSLQRSQFLHHHQELISIGEVFSNNVNSPSTAGDADVPGVGTAIAKATFSGRGFSLKNVEEYGFIMGLTSVYPKAGYSQGIPRIYRQLDRFDYPHPLLSELGMESIKKSELYISSSNFGDWDDDFAYNPRYSDYKVGIDRDRGNFRDNLRYLSDTRRLEATNTDFNDQFLRVIPSKNNLNRPFNVISYLPYSSPLFADINFKITANRQLPYYGLPRF